MNSNRSFGDQGAAQKSGMAPAERQERTEPAGARPATESGRTVRIVGKSPAREPDTLPPGERRREQTELPREAGRAGSGPRRSIVLMRWAGGSRVLGFLVAATACALLPAVAGCPRLFPFPNTNDNGLSNFNSNFNFNDNSVFNNNFNNNFNDNSIFNNNFNNNFNSNLNDNSIFNNNNNNNLNGNFNDNTLNGNDNGLFNDNSIFNDNFP